MLPYKKNRQEPTSEKMLVAAGPSLYIESMWIFVGHRTQTKPVKNGKEAKHFCAACKRETLFREQQAVKAITLYFVPIEYDDERWMVCSGCGGHYEVGDEEAFAPAPQTSWYQRLKSKASGYLSALKANTSTPRTNAPRTRAQAEQDVEKRLAALKKDLLRKS